MKVVILAAGRGSRMKNLVVDNKHRLEIVYGLENLRSSILVSSRILDS